MIGLDARVEDGDEFEPPVFASTRPHAHPIQRVLPGRLGVVHAHGGDRAVDDGWTPSRLRMLGRRGRP